MTNALVLTKLSEEDRKKVTTGMHGEPFEMSRKVSKSWVKVPLKSPEDLRKVLAYVRISYDSATRT